MATALKTENICANGDLLTGHALIDSGQIYDDKRKFG